jgi:four helix bundle protein
MSKTGESRGHRDNAKATLSDSGFRNLYVWKEGKALAVHVFLITQTGLFAEDRSFRDQLRRSAVRIPANIAEGDERGLQRDTLRSLYAAKAALAKLWTQLEIAHEIHYLGDEEMDELSERCRKMGRMLSGLIRARTSVD